MMVCKVFVSSTTRDLAKYREVARDVIGKVNENFGNYFPIMPVSMDSMTPDGERTPPLDDSRRWVRDCNWVVLIVAWNYGYVPPGETFSVTEWEYIEATNTGKKCFVFLAGELTDPQAYQYWPVDRAAEGGQSLADYQRCPEYRTQEDALARFKARIRETRRFNLYSNIEDFRVKLTTTLTNKIIADVFGKLGPQIVALGLKPPLQDCFREVKALAQLKRLHDRLHRIRQFGIRHWREILLSSWPDDGAPSDRAINEYRDGIDEIRDLIGEIRGRADSLPAGLRQAIPHIGQVTAYKFPPVPGNGKDEFTESIEVFASRLQKAFTGCNLQMTLSEQRLDCVYQSLNNSARKAIERGQVAPVRQQALKGELERAAQIYQRLRQVLQNHYDWQRVHDEFEKIDSDIKPDLEGDSPEVCKERERRAADFRPKVLDVIESRGADVHVLLDAATAIVSKEDAERLDVWPGLILRVREHLEAFVGTPDVQRYQAMRTSFDDLFFQIDIETLQAVESSEGRVRAMESGLQGIESAITTPGGL